MHDLPASIRVIIESAYGQGIAEVFWIAVPLAVLSLAAIAFLPNRPLSTKTAAQTLAEEAEEVAIDLADAEAAAGVPSAAVITRGSEDRPARR
ncbi:hypothetical protein [Agromyces marinus]|uniref:hypothetical protein n=1 Tax=Agromyces marinus TaxID=1389020 RepID=UPI0025744124|nr:hypothetical protein [Agromyces marinus]